jgi:hypothetical protein
MGGNKHFEVHCADGVRRHPYEVYNPKYGWHMAVRIENDDTMGRALCVDNGVHAKYFVRTYAKTGGYSYADEKLHAWLLEQGYAHRNSYMDGTKMAYYPTADDFLAPYLDGNQQHVDTRGDHLRIDGNGEYECDCTSGVPSGGGRIQCEDCNNRFDDGDGYWVGIHEETHVCDSCGNDDYTYAYSRRGNQYYVHNHSMVRVGDEYYDDNYLSDNEIVRLEDGDYAHMDDCVMIGDEWYEQDDSRVVRCEDDDDYYLEDEGCWQCAESGNWYSDSTDYVEVDDNKYHPDHAPEQTTEEE